MKSAETLDLLRRFPKSLAGARLSKVMKPDEVLSNFMELPDKLRSDRQVQMQSPMTLPEARRRWEAANGDLTRLRPSAILALCLDAETAIEPRFLRGCLSHPKLAGRLRCVLALINAYFDRWRTMPDPEMMETVLRGVVTTTHHWGKSMDRYGQHASVLFSCEAAGMLARNIVDANRSIDEELNLWGVPPTGGLATAAANEALRRWSVRWSRLPKRIERQRLEDELDYGLSILLADSRVDDQFYPTASDIIVSPFAEGSENVRSQIQKFVMTSPRLGDPRLPRSGPGWIQMDSGARRKILSWLARESIEFFFEFILPKGSEAQERKDFWLRYCGEIQDFQVALCAEHEYSLRTQVRKIPFYSRIAQSTTSAFLMRFSGTPRDVIIVEFSEIGNAAYIHQAPEFEKRVGHMHQSQFRIQHELKHGDFDQRILHHYGWQDKAAQRLAGLGIRP